jgi:hypothetical protein
MDCFVATLLAMTETYPDSISKQQQLHKHSFAISPHHLRELFQKRPAL